MEQKIMDGNSACSYVSYNFTEVAGIYPITPASTMAEKVDEYSASGKTNMFGDVVKVVEMQSEAGAIGMVHGLLQNGVLATTYTSNKYNGSLAYTTFKYLRKLLDTTAVSKLFMT